MTRIHINSENLRDSCLPPLKESIKAINSALEYFDYFTIPYDFSGRQKLIDVKHKLQKISSDLTNVKSWIVDSNSDYNEAIQNLNENNSKLPTSTIKDRNTIV